MNINSKNINKKPLSKGERLKWTPVSKLTPIKLTMEMFDGERLSYEEMTRKNKKYENLIIN